MKFDSINYFFVDIDGTITDYKPGAMASVNLLAGNFLFPIIRDMMVESGWDREKAEAAMIDEIHHNIFWDYIDLVVKFKLSRSEAFNRMRQWHRDNLRCYVDMVETVKELAGRGKQLFIISNNPYWGCLFKLEFAGLADMQGAPLFDHIFATNIVNGCKSSTEVWQRALNRLDIDPAEIATIGDNRDEDGAIPQSLGIGRSFILDRASEYPVRCDGSFVFLNDARHILSGKCGCCEFPAEKSI